MKFKPSERQNKTAAKPSFTVGRVALWAVLIPLSASIIFSGCANSKQSETTQEKRGMNNEAQLKNSPKKAEAVMDTLKLTPVKVRNDFLDSGPKRDSLLKARIKELDYAIANAAPLPDREHPSNLTAAQIKEISKNLVYYTTEAALCDAALKGDKAAVEKYVAELLQFSESVGEKERGEGIIRKFRAIMETK